MIKLIDMVGHNEMCGGYSYSGHAKFDGRTVKEVLEEIKEYSHSPNVMNIGDGFGDPENKAWPCWGIRIDGIPYVGGWCGWKNKYHHELDDEVVRDVRVSGGWYCFYDFDIVTEKSILKR